MGTGRFRGAIIAVVLGLLALAPAYAQAAVGQPLALGAGQNPNVTVDDAGTAYIAFTGQGANSTELNFCRLPRGGTACAPRTTIAAPGDSLSIPLAFLGGTNIHVISYRYGGAVPNFAAVYVFTSTDGGATFDGGVIIGGNLAPNDYIFGPGDTVSAIDSATACGSCFQSWSFDGAKAGVAPKSLSSDHPYLGQLTLLDANTPLAVFAAGGGDQQFRRYSGTGDVNDPANWTPAVDIGSGDWFRLVTGATGTFMITQDSLSGSIMQARRYDGTTFGNRVQITTGTRADDAVEDGSGRIHLVGARFSGGPSNASLAYGTSDDGTSWQNEDVFYPAVPQNLRLDVAADHFGAVVGTLANGSGVFAASVGPRAVEPTTGKFVDASLVSGTVLIQVPGSTKFVQLRKGDVIPVGSIVDATKGRVRITIALPNGTLQSTDFFQGVFKVGQAKSGLATMTLRGGSFSKCGRAAAVHAAKSKKVIRQLWGEGSGKFQTKGRFAAASIRGTTWDTIDRCDGTLIKVTQGSVLVNDLKKHKKIVVKKGHSYLAKG